MKVFKNYFCQFILLLLLSSCSDLSEKGELKEYGNSKNIGGYRFTARVDKDDLSNNSAKLAAIGNVNTSENNVVRVFLKIEKDENNHDFLGSNLDYYLSFGIQNDLKLRQGDIESVCNFSHFEQNYGLTPYHLIIAEFENSQFKSNVPLQLNINSRILGTGPVNLILTEFGYKNKI